MTIIIYNLIDGTCSSQLVTHLKHVWEGNATNSFNCVSNYRTIGYEISDINKKTLFIYIYMQIETTLFKCVTKKCTGTY